MESCQGGEIKTSRGKRMIANAVIVEVKKRKQREVHRKRTVCNENG